MNNFEYIKTLSKDEMINYWREDEGQSAGLDMWRKWLDKEHK